MSLHSWPCGDLKRQQCTYYLKCFLLQWSKTSTLISLSAIVFGESACSRERWSIRVNCFRMQPGARRLNQQLIFCSFAVSHRWSGDSSGGVVSKAGSVPHPIWSGGEGLPSCPGTAPAPHCLLELPWEWRRHQVKTLKICMLFLHQLTGMNLLTILSTVEASALSRALRFLSCGKCGQNRGI